MDIFLVAWTGGLDMPQYKACKTDVEAHALQETWAVDAAEDDRIDVLRINPKTLTIELLWTA